MPSVFTFANRKGGVGKSTVVRHVAYFLEQFRVRTLVIDNDPQANQTLLFGVDGLEAEAKNGVLAQVILEGKPMADVVVRVSDYIDLVPSSESETLAEAAAHLLVENSSPEVLREALRPIASNYDAVLIDCGPNLDRLLINALATSNYVLIPVKTEFMCTRGIPTLINTTNRVRRLNPSLQVLGIVPTMFHRGNIADEDAMRDIRESAADAGVRVFDPIPAATNYDKATRLGEAVFQRFPRTAGREEYQSLAEVINAS